MPQVTEQKKQLYASHALVPKVGPENITREQINKLFFSSTAKSSFVPKEMLLSDTSFSDVHKAAQRVRRASGASAPFWSREMTRYQQAFIPLPLDGSSINKELAKTFHPDEEMSSISRTSSVPLRARTKYEDDFGSNVEKGVDYRTANQKPKIQKHVRDDDKLLYTDSITHEVFPVHKGVKPREPFRPPLDKPTNASAGFKFCGSTRYAEEFLDLSKEGYRVELVKGRDDSNRVQGNSIPNRLRDYLYENEVKDILALNISLEKIIADTQTVARCHKPVPDDNPYLEEYLHAYKE